MQIMVFGKLTFDSSNNYIFFVNCIAHFCINLFNYHLPVLVCAFQGECVGNFIFPLHNYKFTIIVVSSLQLSDTLLKFTICYMN